MRSEKTEIIVHLLEQVAKGELSADLALQRWPDIDSETDDYIAASWHDLSHFAADKDIRDKDPGYAIYQMNLLRERARKIREGNKGTG